MSHDCWQCKEVGWSYQLLILLLPFKPLLLFSICCKLVFSTSTQRLKLAISSLEMSPCSASYAPRLYLKYPCFENPLSPPGRQVNENTVKVWSQAHWITKIILTADWMDGEAHYYNFKTYLRYKVILVPLLKCWKEKHCFALIIFMYIHCSSSFVQPAHGFPLSVANYYSTLCKFHILFIIYHCLNFLGFVWSNTFPHSIYLSIQWHSRVNKADVAIAFDPLP